MSLPAAYQQLVYALDQLPSVGPKAAARLAQFLLRNDNGELLLQALSKAKQEIQLCQNCQNFSAAPLCELCLDNKRSSALLVVSSVDELNDAEQAKWPGRYFVLHGLLSPVHGLGPKQLKLDVLAAQMKGYDSITLALEGSAEGRASAQFISALAAQANIPCHYQPWQSWLEQQQKNRNS